MINMKNEQFLNMMKDLIREEYDRKQVLLETPSKKNIDKILTEKLSRLFNK